MIVQLLSSSLAGEIIDAMFQSTHPSLPFLFRSFNAPAGSIESDLLDLRAIMAQSLDASYLPDINATIDTIRAQSLLMPSHTLFYYEEGKPVSDVTLETMDDGFKAAGSGSFSRCVRVRHSIHNYIALQMRGDAASILGFINIVNIARWVCRCFEADDDGDASLSVLTSPSLPGTRAAPPRCATLTGSTPIHRSLSTALPQRNRHTPQLPPRQRGGEDRRRHISQRPAVRRHGARQGAGCVDDGGDVIVISVVLSKLDLLPGRGMILRADLQRIAPSACIIDHSQS